MRSELLKLISVRTVMITLLLNIPFGVLFAMVGKGNLATGSDTAANMQHLTLLQGGFAAAACLILTIVAVLGITSEHSTGQIGSTLRTVPRRWYVTFGKSAALGILVWIVGFTTSLITALTMFGSAGPLPADAILTVLLTSVCGGLAWAALATISLSIGGILRSAAFSIATAFALFLVAPTLIRSIPGLQDFMSYLPTSAASTLAAPIDSGTALLGALTLAAWAAVGIGVWGALLAHRDV
ncbi:ABC transporter permease [Mycetocola saprophilus]|uniref:ABC transporter permease n=1 Tax=Mycetocola saprophilus TaxID=76636 RepID=UPI003BF40588